MRCYAALPLENVAVEAAEEPFEMAGRKVNRGSLIIRKATADELRQTAATWILKFMP